MIQNDEQLRQSRQALVDVEAALAALNRRRGSIHSDRFALMAEPLLDQIEQIRADIENYVGVTDARASIHRTVNVSPANVKQPIH